MVRRVPIVDVTVHCDVPDDLLGRLREALFDVVADGVACPEEPWTGPPGPGDIEVRFHERHALDLGELAVIVEVRTKRHVSRLTDAQARADRMRDALRAVLDPLPFGVWLLLHDGAWSQSV
jgi:hypothetical protein